jgi:RecB family exonuclease
MTPRSVRLVVSPRAETRLDEARAWLMRRGRSEDVWVLGPDAATGDLVRAAARSGGATLGWRRSSLARLAATLAAPLLAEQGLALASSLSMTALASRVVHDHAARGLLGRFAVVGDRPGLSRALARTTHELAMAGASLERLREVDADLATLVVALEAAALAAGLADRATIMRLAATAELPRFPVLLVDPSFEGAVDRDLVAALVARSSDVLATAPEDDHRTLGALEQALGVTGERPSDRATGSLARSQRSLFGEALVGDDDGEVTVLSAPGESREAVEIARRLLAEAARGVPFDRMAVLLRGPEAYRAHLAEALGRARIPAYFAAGTRAPDPSGRARAALLACAAADLSARRFCEYLSLGEMPRPDADGAPPTAPAAGDRWVAPEDELSPDAAVDDEPRDGDPVTPAPRRWEKLVIEAAVIGGRERWNTRLAGLRDELAARLAADDDPESPRAEGTRRDLAQLAALERFALPLVEALAALPARATWGVYLEALSSLATRALRRPERVLSVLAELAPMADVGPVTLAEVRMALAPRLVELAVPPLSRRYGRVYVGAAERARGLAFDVVLIPGLVERGFPRKVVEDPLLADEARARLGAGLVTRADRVESERLALRLAVGAAGKRLSISWPRVDASEGRPRTPSFYGLEVLRAAEGRLPGFDELSQRASRDGAARLGWPAPARRDEAIDDAEHDLALLADVLSRPGAETRGAARYLVTETRHLARALRARHQRWRTTWTAYDGLDIRAASDDAKNELGKHALAARAYAPTALETFAACPYRFFLRAVMRLSPRDDPSALEEIDPRVRGAIVHDVLHDLGVRLEAASLLPLDAARLADAEPVLVASWRATVDRHAETLAPAVRRTWDDAMAAILADVREWLRRRVAVGPWSPIAFELGFGLTGSPKLEAVVPGARLRGAIDVVERDESGALVAVDYKTGRSAGDAGLVIAGGRVLQPVLYAMALEQLYPGERVAGARLSYCTTVGEFSEITVPLDAYAREAAGVATTAIDRALAAGTLPASPSEGACAICDYAAVCGPDAEKRAARKPAFQSLFALRRHP